MYVLLGDEPVHFLCDNKQAEQQLGLLFLGWPRPAASLYQAYDKGPILLDIQVIEHLDPVPDTARLVFADNGSQTSVWQDEDSWTISFGEAALAHIPLEYDDQGTVSVGVQLTSNSILAARLEDVVFSSLAPVLRRRGLFLMHAFAAVKNGAALLLVGESGCGKTTTGLSLLSQGWRYLANDVVIVGEEGGSIVAWPTPGGIGIDSTSYRLLEEVLAPEDEGGRWASDDNALKRYFPAKRLTKGWAARAPVKKILFPRLEEPGNLRLKAVTRSVTLARILEASVDRWDIPYLDEHVRMMEDLSRQAGGFDLSLNRDLQALAGLISSADWADSEDGQALK